MKRMLISADSQKGTDRHKECRMVLMEDNILKAMEVENSQTERRKGNIYIGTIRSIEPSLGAVFVDCGFGGQENGRQGFLPVKEIASRYFKSNAKGAAAEQAENPEPIDIKEQLSIGQKVVVQVQKEERGTKGASLTTHLSLPGLYLVLIDKPNSSKGISRRVTEEERLKLRELLSGLQVPEGLGIIARTASLGQTTDVLQKDLDMLLERLSAIQKLANEMDAPKLIHKENNLLMLALRNHLTDADEIIIDDKALFDTSREYIKHVCPAVVDKVKLYENEVTPLFVKFQVEHQIESVYRSEVRLPSGGLIAIHYTEALVSIDVNSARATGGKDIEETALNTNLEAAEEIARQLRLRDIGGLIVIDFIDMMPRKNLREVENHLQKAVRSDRARIQIGRISRFGLLEMSRQRLHSSLGESNQMTCPRCSGRGTIQKVESLALSLLRLLEEEAYKSSLVQLQAHLPIDVATFILNEKRKVLQSIEKRQSVSILIIPNPHLDTPHYFIKKSYREVGAGDNGNKEHSYQLLETPEMEVDDRLSRLDQSPSKPALPSYLSPAYRKREIKKVGLLSRVFKKLFSAGSKKKPSSNRGGSRSNNTRSQYRGRGRQHSSTHRRRPNPNYQSRRFTSGGNRSRGSGSGNRRNTSLIDKG